MHFQTWTEKESKFIINQSDKIKYLQKCQTIQLLEIKIINLLGQRFGVMKKDVIVGGWGEMIY